MCEIKEIFGITKSPFPVNEDVMLSTIDGQHGRVAIMRVDMELKYDLHAWKRFYIHIMFKSRCEGNEMVSGEFLKIRKLANYMQGLVIRDSDFISVFNKVL